MLPLNPAKIPALFQDALKLQGAGRLQAAADAYARILAVRPDLAEAHFQLGRIALARKAPGDAAKRFSRAAELKPKEAAVWQAYAEAVNQMGDPHATERLLSQAKSARLRPEVFQRLQQKLGVGRARTRVSTGRVPPAEVQKAVAAIQRRAFADAAERVRRLLRTDPKAAILHDILAVAEAERGQTQAAEKAWKTAIALEPGYAEAHAKYGRFLVQRGERGRAVPLLRKALELAPRLTDALTGLGLALEQDGASQEATTLLRRSLRERPEQPDARLALARLLSAAGDHSGVIETVDPLLNTQPGHVDALQLKAASLLGLEQADAAVALYDAALTEPDAPATLFAGKAILKQRLGRFDEAETLFREALSRDPLNTDTYRLFLASHKLDPGDPLIPEMERIWAEEELSDAGRISLGFALAKALEDTKAHDRVFTYLRPANDLMRKSVPYEIDSRHREVDRLIRAFAPIDFARTVAGATDFAPIFVTGLPRSGTTLIEQVLASHSQVAGGGELGTARRFAWDALSDASGTIRSLDDLDDADIAGIGRQTETEMRALFPDADRITDKGVQTYNLFGPIRLALPRAKFVLVERDPRDSALSMYRNLFGAQLHRQSYSLSDLGGYYRAFRKIVAFWQEKLPGQIHIARYEAFLDDPEAETRALLAFCDLDWEDACLAFHKNTRRVDTLSMAQVRQPIYKTSMQAWRRYEDELTPLIEAIGDALPEDYRDGT